MGPVAPRAAGPLFWIKQRKDEHVAKSRFSFEKRRKELDRKKKKDAKREARAERKAEDGAGGVPVVELDEWGNPVVEEAEEAEEPEEEDD